MKLKDYKPNGDYCIGSPAFWFVIKVITAVMLLAWSVPRLFGG